MWLLSAEQCNQIWPQFSALTRWNPPQTLLSTSMVSVLTCTLCGQSVRLLHCCSATAQWWSSVRLVRHQTEKQHKKLSISPNRRSNVSLMRWKKRVWLMCTHSKAERRGAASHGGNSWKRSQNNHIRINSLNSVEFERLTVAMTTKWQKKSQNWIHHLKTSYLVT